MYFVFTRVCQSLICEYYSLYRGKSSTSRTIFFIGTDRLLQCWRCMMSGMRLPGLRHASPRWLNLLAHIIGRHGDTSKGHVDAVNLPEVKSVACWKRQAPGTTPISPDRLLMHLDGAGQFTSWQVFFMRQERTLGDQVCNLNADVK